MATSTRPARILVVDDDVGLLVLMAEALRSEGYSVDTAGSGTAALAWLAERTTDLMLLDLKMRDIEGAVLLDRLRQKTPPVPFLVVTGQGDEKAAVEMMKQGALDYVMKDTGLLDLLPGVVRRALEVVERDRALAAAEAEGRRLEREMVEVAEGERRRIGEDLHDGLGQQLTAIELVCTALKEDASRKLPELAKGLERMGKMLREAIAQTRFLARGLVPISDDPDALRIGLAELVEHIGSIGRLHCRLDCPSPVILKDRSTAAHLYRIAQEAVNNVIKHAEATEVTIRLSQVGGVLELQISDNGRGLPSSKGGGLGMEVMKHRAGMIGGELTVVSKRGHGVTVTCVLPVFQ
ncbi:MAG: response regulator [Opitutaceae bacterium]